MEQKFKEIVGIDTETNGLSFEGKVACVQVYHPDKGAFIFPINMVGVTEEMRQKSIESVKKVIKNYRLVGHNLAFDILQLMKLGITEGFDIYGDSQILSCMSQQSETGLKKLIVSNGVAKSEDILTLDMVVQNYDSTQVSIQDKNFMKYAAKDPEYAFKLEKVFREKYQSLVPVYEQELTYIVDFIKMTYKGLRVDWNGFVKFRKDYFEKISKMKNSLNEDAGFDFKVRSRKDMEVIFDKLRLPEPPIKTEKGAVSYSQESLEYLKGNSFIDKLLEYQSSFSVDGTLSTMEKYVSNIIPDFPILHPHYRIVGVDGTSRVYSCVVGDTKIEVNGEIITVEKFYNNFKEGDLIKSFESEQVVEEVVFTGEKDLYEIELEDGKILKCSLEEKIALKFKNGIIFKSLEDLCVGEDVIIF